MEIMSDGAVKIAEMVWTRYGFCSRTAVRELCSGDDGSLSPRRLTPAIPFVRILIDCKNLDKTRGVGVSLSQLVGVAGVCELLSGALVLSRQLQPV